MLSSVKWDITLHLERRSQPLIIWTTNIAHKGVTYVCVCGWVGVHTSWRVDSSDEFIGTGEGSMRTRFGLDVKTTNRWISSILTTVYRARSNSIDWHEVTLLSQRFVSFNKGFDKLKYLDRSALSTKESSGIGWLGGGVDKTNGKHSKKQLGNLCHLGVCM